MSPDNQIPGDPNLIQLSPSSGQGPRPMGKEPVPAGEGRAGEIAAGEGGCSSSGAPGGIHNRPPIPGSGEKAECPKFMSHGPCGGVRKGGYCEVFPEMMCPWVVMYFDLEKLGKTEWMTQV
jgi:Methylene-tetrahydrofolate reductase C terminal